VYSLSPDKETIFQLDREWENPSAKAATHDTITFKSNKDVKIPPKSNKQHQEGNIFF
jgi:hypothetical protein